MALRRYTRSVDGTIPIPALLYDDEEILASQDGMGIYDGLQKSVDHQAGTVHVSTHRLFYIDAEDEFTHSFAMDLSYVTRTEYYAGLFKSSPKATLHLSTGALGPGTNTFSATAFESWECEVCGYRNPPGLSPAAARICTLCGVPRNIVPGSKITSSSNQHLSTSLPSSSSISGSASPASQEHRPRSVPCPACTFLNHPSLRACEICSTLLPSNNAGMKSAPASRPGSPDADDEDITTMRFIKLSFRKGGDKVFYSVLRRSLQAKAWEVASRQLSKDASELPSRQNPIGRSGINGILQVVENSAQNRESDLQDSLKDLEALMIKAKEMVSIAAELNERLTASSTTTSMSSTTALVPSTEPEEATFIRSSLSQLGLQMTNTPVTMDMVKDERKWIEELARELAQVLQGSSTNGHGKRTGLIGERGILALDEVWGGWNRARGVALIPPSTFLSVLPYLPSFTDPPIRKRTFASGLCVLHTPPFTDAAFAARLSGLIALSGPKTTIEVAQEEKITISLAADMISAVENDGYVCRDDGSSVIKGGGSGSGAEVRWWPNICKDYVWDGQR